MTGQLFNKMPGQNVISTKDHAFEDSQALSPVLQMGRYFICSKSLSPHHSLTYADFFFFFFKYFLDSCSMMNKEAGHLFNDLMDYEILVFTNLTIDAS